MIAGRRPGETLQQLGELPPITAQAAVVGQSVQERQPYVRRVGIELPGVDVDHRGNAAPVAARDLAQQNPVRHAARDKVDVVDYKDFGTLRRAHPPANSNVTP